MRNQKAVKTNIEISRVSKGGTEAVRDSGEGGEEISERTGSVERPKESRTSEGSKDGIETVRAIIARVSAQERSPEVLVPSAARA